MSASQSLRALSRSHSGRRLLSTTTSSHNASSNNITSKAWASAGLSVAAAAVGWTTPTTATTKTNPSSATTVCAASTAAAAASYAYIPRPLNFGAAACHVATVAAQLAGSSSSSNSLHQRRKCRLLRRDGSIKKRCIQRSGTNHDSRDDRITHSVVSAP